MLGEQLQALARQDITDPWELLIVDNGIIGDLSPLLARFSTAIPRLRVITADQRPGRSYALNQAIQQAHSSRLITLDSDDVVNSTYLSAMNDALSQHEFVGARMDSTTLNPKWLRGRRKPLQSARLDMLLGHRPAVIGAGMAFTRSAFERVSGFDEDMIALEDLDISLRMQQAGIHPVFAPTAVVQYRYRGGYLAIFRQERSYSRHEVLLYHKHQGVLAPRRLRRTIQGWVDVLVAATGISTRTGRAQLATSLGAAVGRVEGSVRYGIRHL